MGSKFLTDKLNEVWIDLLSEPGCGFYVDLVHVGNFKFQVFIDLVFVSKMLIYATPCP